MDTICDARHCTGCAACMNRCPKQCIEMKPDNLLGHLYPVIDHNKCIDCGACQKVCPANSEPTLRKPLVAYAGWDKTESEYLSSTSGGAASAFARFIIRSGGVVYGCALLPNIEVRHIRVDTLEDIAKLKGSKYVQSTMGLTYRSVKEDLRQGRKVLFIGTPCQVAGVKSYVGEKDSANLFTVDLICHGTPPLAFLRKHILKITKGQVPSQIFFRKGDYLLLLLLLGEKELYRSALFERRYEDVYYNTFFDGFSYRNSCNTCRYAQPNRVSDVTIGDFWGLRGNLPLEHPHGCSVLLPATEKGLELIDGIRGDFNLFERTVEEAVNGNDQLRHPKKADFRIRMFRKILPTIGVGNAYRLCILDKIVKRKLRKIIKGKYSMNNDNSKKQPKCGIITFHSAHNYGSVLQSYAMVMMMRKLGTDAELIDFRHPHTTDTYEWRFWTHYKNWRWNLKDILLRGVLGIGKDRERVFRDFIDNRLPKSARVRGRGDIDPNRYDVLVCGSDQIWNPVSTGENDPIYFLDFGNTKCKFSYAASAGSCKFPQEEHDKYFSYLKHLKSIGVREQFLHDYLKDEFGFESVVNPDPTLLLNANEWADIEEEYPDLPQQYLLVYTLAKVDETLAFARKVATKLGLPVVQICNTRRLKGASKKNVDHNIMNASPQQFLWLFHHANFIVTNTFHGNMFSVIFRKDFVHYDVNGNDSRITTLHEAIGLKKTRMIKNVDSLKEKQINYNLIENDIAAYAHKGVQYIKSNLNCDE